MMALALAAGAVALGSAGAQQQPQPPEQTQTPAPRPRAAGVVSRQAFTHPAAYDSLAFAALRWREIGPFRGGRSVAVAGSGARPYEYYMGTTGGGVFKTGDGGYSWAPVTDKYFGGSIGSVAVSESNPDVVYVGGGESQIRGNLAHGEGMWKSTDAGKTWVSLGLRETRHIGRVRVHPRDPNTVYVAAFGHAYGPNSERGVYKSTDGGKGWRKVLFRNDSTGAIDLAMDPSNPDVLYAAFWQAGRKPWLLVSGGAGSGIFKTTDGGEHWTEITRNPGLPQAGLVGNIGLAVSPARPGVVWAIIEHDSGGVFRSGDGGATWTRTNSERKLRQRAWYYTRIHADPKDTSVVYVNNVSFHKSTDNGKTFRAMRAPHGDSHDFWVAPNDARRMIEGNDGGANVSFNGGRTWSEQDYATAQFYHVITTDHYPYQVCGAQQDNSTLCGPSRHEGGITTAEWQDAGGGESGYIAARSDDPDIVYAGSYGGLLTRKDMRTGFERNVNPWPINPMGHSAEDLKYRFQWTFPIVVSPHDPNVLYAGANVIFRSTNEGQSWSPISPDLTKHDPATLGPSGGPITRDQTSVEYYGTVFTIAESPVARGVIWSGSDDGVVRLTRDNGRSWQNVTPFGLKPWGRVSLIEPSPHAAGTAYAAINRYQMDDFAPYIYKTTDFGKTWAKIVDGIPETEFVRAVREDPEAPGLLYAGTERGVWVSFDAGGRWQRLQLNLPPVPVHDLVVKEGDLVAATHGRSFWVLDDLSPLRQLSSEVVAKQVHLFRPRDAYRTQWGGGFGGGGGGGNAANPVGANPPSGAVLYYWLKDANREVTLDFLDARGSVIRSLTSRQDSAARADSLRGDSVRTARRDSLTRAGVSADSLKKLEQRGEGQGEGAPGGAGESEEGPRRAAPPPRVPNRAGLNRFAWNLRYPDASSFENLIMWAAGTQGPIAPPGTYSVRLRVDGGEAQTATFALRKDPRSKATTADLVEQFTLLTKIRDKTSEANDAVKQIRALRAQLAEREHRLPAAEIARYRIRSTVLAERLSDVEQELYQVKNQSSQDPLNYPIKLNNQMSALAGVVASTEARPTDQSLTAFNILAIAIDRQLLKLRETIQLQLPPINGMLRAAGLPEIPADTGAVRRVAER